MRVVEIGIGIDVKPLNFKPIELENVTVTAFRATLYWPGRSVSADSTLEPFNDNVIVRNQNIHPLEIVLDLLQGAHHRRASFLHPLIVKC